MIRRYLASLEFQRIRSVKSAIVLYKNSNLFAIGMVPDEPLFEKAVRSAIDYGNWRGNPLEYSGNINNRLYTLMEI